MAIVRCGVRMAFYGENGMPFNSLSNLLSSHDWKAKTLYRVGFVLCILTVSVLSLLPEDELPDVSLSDKISHFIAYSVIVTFGLVGYRGVKAAILVVVGAIALGGSLEIGQLFVPGRSGDMLDFVANCIGVVAGVLLARLVLMVWARLAAPAQTS